MDSQIEINMWVILRIMFLIDTALKTIYFWLKLQKQTVLLELSRIFCTQHCFSRFTCHRSLTVFENFGKILKLIRIYTHNYKKWQNLGKVFVTRTV